MKKWLQWTARILGCLAGLGLCLLLTVGFLGYRRYRIAIEATPLSALILTITEQEEYVPYEEISPWFVQALTAVEDRRFFQREGIDWIALVRAAIVNIFSGEIREGGSTLGQQLAKNLYFSFETSLTRKVAELFVMRDLEQQLSKEELFALYANVIYYGDGYTGIAQASQGYFKKQPKALTLAEASLLAGLPQAPSRYQLSSGATLAIQRQKIVLQAMIRCNMINEEESRLALAWSEKIYANEE